MKRSMVVVTLLVVMSILLTSCGGTPAPTGPVKITWWHAMGGTNGTAIDTLTKEFNASQSKCVAEAVFQNNYDDLLNKLKAGLQSKDVPALTQMYDLGTRLLYDLDVAVPMQDFIDKEKFNVSDIEPNIMAYYSINKKLYSMPFNTSNPMLYYNKTAFTAAGLDPNKPPRTFDEIMQYATKLTKKDAAGKVSMYGYSQAIYGWFFEQLLAASGANFLDKRQRPRCTGDQGHLQRGRRPEDRAVVEGHVRQGHRRQLWPGNGRHAESIRCADNSDDDRVHCRPARSPHPPLRASSSWAPASYHDPTRPPTRHPAPSSAAPRCGF